MDIDFKTYFTQASDLITAYAVDGAAALLILVFGWIFASWARARTRSALGRSKRFDATLTPFIANLVRYAILIFVLLAVLNRFGVQTASVIAVLGAAGLAIGFALQGTLSNIAAGIVLLFLRPFSVGDFVDASGTSGTIESIGLFTTDMKTTDGIFISVPNKEIWSKAITNYSRNPQRRIDLTIGIGYEDDMQAAMDILLGMATDDERVLDEPAPLTMITELGDSAVSVNLRCWTKTGDYWATLWDFYKQAKLKFDEAEISIPYPQQDVHMFQVTDKPKKAA